MAHARLSLTKRQLQRALARFQPQLDVIGHN